MNRLATWLTTRRGRFAGTVDFVHSLLLMAEEAGTMGFIRDHAQLRWYPPGSYVIEQGEVSTELFMISSGRADVWQEQADGSRKQLRRIGPGEFFGELGVAGILMTRAMTRMSVLPPSTRVLTGPRSGGRVVPGGCRVVSWCSP